MVFPTIWHTLVACWRLMRPLQLGAVMLVYLWGLIIAWQAGWPMRAETILWGGVALFVAAASIHTANEYADFTTDRLTQRTPFSGGSGVLPSGILFRWQALYLAGGLLVCGLLLAFSGWMMRLLPGVALGLLVLGIVGGWMYSLPPLKLAWRGWGEITNAALGGLLLPVYGYGAASGQLQSDSFIYLPFTLLVFTNLLATTWPDRQADAEVGKHTLAVRWPSAQLRWVYCLSSISALCAAAGLATALPAYRLMFIGLWAALPAVVWGWHTYTRQETPYPAVAAMLLALIGQMSMVILADASG